MAAITWKNIGNRLPVNYSPAAGNFLTKGFDQFANLANQGRAANIEAHQLAGKQAADNALLQMQGLGRDNFNTGAQNIVQGIQGNPDVDLANVLQAKNNQRLFLDTLDQNAGNILNQNLINEALPDQQKAQLASTQATTRANNALTSGRLFDLNTKQQNAKEQQAITEALSLFTDTNAITKDTSFDPAAFTNFAIGQGYNQSNVEAVLKPFYSTSGLADVKAAEATAAQNAYDKTVRKEKHDYAVDLAKVNRKKSTPLTPEYFDQQYGFGYFDEDALTAQNDYQHFTSVLGEKKAREIITDKTVSKDGIGGLSYDSAAAKQLFLNAQANAAGLPPQPTAEEQQALAEQQKRNAAIWESILQTGVAPAKPGSSIQDIDTPYNPFSHPRK